MYSCVVSLVAWLVFSVFADTVVEAGYHNYGHNRGSQLNLAGDDAGWPAPEDGTVQDCAGSYDWSVYVINPDGTSFYKYGADISFDLPVNSDLLYFLARGGGNIGGVTIVNSDAVKDTADVFVYVGYHTQEALDHVNVCLLAKENGEGVGIYTPDDWVPSDDEGMHFDVTVTLPATSSGELLAIKKFESNTSHYSYTIGDIQDSVYFDVFSIQADAAGIKSDSIFAGIGTFRSTRAFIRGAFDVSSSLELTTTNADIDAQVGLRNDVASYLRVDGVPLRIDDNPRQSTFSDYATSGNFKVSASTNNGPITLSYTNSPVNSIQNLVATTSGSPVTVSLNSAYEGGFILDTTGSNPITVSKSGATDPSGEGRERILDKNSQSTTHADGTVYWDPSGPGAPQSNVQIKTSRSPIKLTV